MCIRDRLIQELHAVCLTHDVFHFFDPPLCSSLHSQAPCLLRGNQLLNISLCLASLKGSIQRQIPKALRIHKGVNSHIRFIHGHISHISLIDERIAFILHAHIFQIPRIAVEQPPFRNRRVSRVSPFPDTGRIHSIRPCHLRVFYSQVAQQLSLIHICKAPISSCFQAC